MAQKTYPAGPMVDVATKTCVKCGVEKAREADFHRDSTRPDGRFPYCKPCLKVERAGQYEREVEIHEAQGGVCAICQQPERFRNTDGLRPLVVDHDHTTGTVRGLLCHACNVCLGLAADDPDRLESAARYLRGRS